MVAISQGILIEIIISITPQIGSNQVKITAVLISRLTKNDSTEFVNSFIKTSKILSQKLIHFP